MYRPSSRPVLITGGTGFLGGHTSRALKEAGWPVVTVGSEDADLTRFDDTLALLESVAPDTIVHLAGLTGGIGIHRSRGAELLFTNTMMGLHLLEAARLSGVRRVLVAGTAASYGSEAGIPSKEADLDRYLPSGSSVPYALAKRTVQEAHRLYRDQYGMGGGVLVLTNLYGPGDHFGEESSHVAAALVPRFVEAARTAAKEVTVWGTGSATRDFLYVEDAADAFVRSVERLDADGPVNIGSGRETSIRELAETLATESGFDGEIVWDTTKPDGAPRRTLDTSLAEELLGFQSGTHLSQGLRQTIDWYRTKTMEGPGRSPSL